MRLLVITLFVACCLSSSQVVNVFRTYHLANMENSAQQKVGEILVLSQDRGEVTSELQLVFQSLIESSVFENLKDYAVLSFKGRGIDQMYTIRHSNVLMSNYKEVINIIVNHNSSVVGFNYFQEKLKKKEHKSSTVEVIKSEQGKQHVFTYSMAPVKAKGAETEQEQTFFSKYKYYIIGFVVVVYAMSSMDPQKGNQAGGQGQGQGQQAGN